MRARCLRTVPEGTPGTAFPTPRVGLRFIMQDHVPTRMSFRGPVGISRHRSAECNVPAGDCHVAWRLLAMTVMAGGWFHRCVASVRQHLRARCLRTAPEGTPGTAFPTPIVGQCRMVQECVPTTMSYRARRARRSVLFPAPEGPVCSLRKKGLPLIAAALWHARRDSNPRPSA